MILHSSKTMPQCRQELTELLDNQALRGRIRTVKKNDSSRLIFSLYRRAFGSLVPFYAWTFVYVSFKGTIESAETGATAKGRLGYGPHPLVVFALAAINFLLCFLVSTKYENIPMYLILLVTLVFTLLDCLPFNLISRFSSSGEDCEDELMRIFTDGLQIQSIEG